ncbi:MAG TPA: hypothetical protein VIF84_07490 [Candidatus Limnocylindrales bacterium]
MRPRPSFMLGGSLLLAVTFASGCSTASSAPPAPASPAPASVPTQSSPDTSPSTAPALTETFTSAVHGLSVSYPAGWVTKAASEPWTGPEWSFEDPKVDIVHDPSLDDHLFLGIGSVPLDATRADQWVADRMAAYECSATEPVTVDGASGSICVDGALALVSTGGRGYMILLYTSGDEGWLESVYDRAWFEDILATVDLRPEDAVDTAPSASP